MARLVVFSGDLSFAVCKGIAELDRRIAGTQWLVICHSPARTVGRLLRSQWRNLRKNGWRWIPYQIAEVLHRVRLFAGRNVVEEAPGPGAEYRLSHIRARPNVECVDTDDIHSSETIDRVRQFAPDLGIALAAPILRQALFDIPRLGTINLHKGRVPDYRGMPPAFWEFWNNDREVGCTIHRVTAGLDRGEVVAQSVVSREPYSTVRALQLTLDEVGIELTCQAAGALLSGTASAAPQPAGGHTYRKPTLKQAAQLRARVDALQPARRSLAYRLVKNIYLFARLQIGQVWLALFSPKPTVTVILYHRVTDQLRDSLTTGIEQFERQMSLIRKHCTPISIEQVVNGEFPRRPGKPLVCVTFDDGYEDNYVNAVPLLLRHRVPSAFFVSTGFIGSGREFPHDGGKVPIPLAKMSWDNLRDMRRDGFVIGSHTVNHINCAAEDTETVRTELKQSLQRLRVELQMNNVILAYPFGGREHMTPARLELVKEAGYTGCLSAYGGFNRGSVARYNVLRGGINWGFSDLAFRCRIAGIT